VAVQLVASPVALSSTESLCVPFASEATGKDLLTLGSPPGTGSSQRDAARVVGARSCRELPLTAYLAARCHVYKLRLSVLHSSRVTFALCTAGTSNVL
jgi:hypothetical protein